MNDSKSVGMVKLISRMASSCLCLIKHWTRSYDGNKVFKPSKFNKISRKVFWRGQPKFVLQINDYKKTPKLKSMHAIICLNRFINLMGLQNCWDIKDLTANRKMQCIIL